MEDRIVENIKVIYIVIMIEVEIDQEGHIQEIIPVIEIGVPVTVDQDQDLKLVQTETE